MKPQEVVARHLSSRQVVRIRWRDGVICDERVLSERAETGWWMAPGLVDLQVNGFAGVDFQAAGLSEGELLQAARGLALAGCTRFFLTLITAEWGDLMRRLRHLRSLRHGSARLRAAIAGWHLEGPFLSAVEGFHGTHEPALMRDPTPDLVTELRAATAGDPVLLTLAPEREGAIEAIAQAASLGMRVSLGHTDASAERLAAAVAAGASGFTHLGNACPQRLDRHDNILWRVFETQGLMVSLIPDGLHVSPPLFRLVHRLVPLDSILYVSDAMAAAGVAPGRYRLGNLELDVGTDQAVRAPGSTHFAGSALRPVEGVFRAARMLGCTWQEVWRRYALAPCDWLDLSNGIAVGQRADFVLLRVSPREELEGLRAFVGGEEIQ